MTQDVFLSAYKNLSGFDGAHEKAWLCRIAANKCLDFLKQAQRRTIPTEDAYFTGIQDHKQSSPEETYLITEAKGRVALMCGQLKSPYREIALLHFYEELSPQEIAERTGKNVKTVQTQIYRTKALLRKLVERSG